MSAGDSLSQLKIKKVSKQLRIAANRSCDFGMQVSKCVVVAVDSYIPAAVYTYNGWWFAYFINADGSTASNQTIDATIYYFDAEN